jgi:hypothetical protein
MDGDGDGDGDGVYLVCASFFVPALSSPLHGEDPCLLWLRRVGGSCAHRALREGRRREAVGFVGLWGWWMGEGGMGFAYLFAPPHAPVYAVIAVIAASFSGRRGMEFRIPSNYNLSFSIFRTLYWLCAVRKNSIPQTGCSHIFHPFVFLILVSSMLISLLCSAVQA